MFEDLFLAFYLLITIVQRFLRTQLHILWWACLMLSANIGNMARFPPYSMTSAES